MQQWLIDAFIAEMETTGPYDVPFEVMVIPNIKTTEDSEEPLFAFKAKSDPDTMYLHQALRQPDRKEFVKVMDKELTDQFDHRNFTVMHKSTVPEGATVLPTVWAMCRK